MGECIPNWKNVCLVELLAVMNELWILISMSIIWIFLIYNFLELVDILLLE